MLKILLAFTLLLTVVIAKANQEPIHLEKINSAMDVLAAIAVNDDDMVDYAKPVFDEKVTDLKKEKIKYDLSGSLKNSPWKTGTHSEITASSTLYTDRDPKHTGIEIISSSKVKTDTLAMLREGGIIALRKAKYHRPKFKERIIDNLKKLSEVSSMKGLYDILVDSQVLSVAVLQDIYETETAYLTCRKAKKCGTPEEQSEEQIAYLEESIAKVGLEKAAYQSVKISANPSTTNVKWVTLLSNKAQGFVKQYKGNVKTNTMDLIIDENSCSGKLTAFIPETAKSLDDLKVELENDMVSLQSGDLDAKNKTYSRFRDALFHFRKVVLGEFK